MPATDDTHEKNGPADLGRSIALIVRFGLFVLAGLICWAIFAYLIRPGGAFGWDEAAHSLKALQITKDLNTWDWMALFFDVYRQVYWPPLHACVMGASFLFIHPSVISARAISLAFYVPSAALVYVIAHQLKPRNPEIAGSVSTILFLTSPLVVSSAASAMLEMPALFFLVLALLTKVWLNEHGHRAVAYLWLGIAVALVYFTKSNYGVLLALALGIAALLDAWFDGQPIFSRPNIYAVMPLLLSLVIWFAYPPKITGTWNTLINQRFGVQDPYNSTGFLFYPNALLGFCSSSWISLLAIAATIGSIRFWKNRNIRFLLVIAFLQFGIALLHPTKVIRHLLPMFPSVVLVSAFLCGEYWDLARVSARWLMRAATVVICCYALIALRSAMQPIGVSNGIDVVDTVARVAAGSRSTLVLGAGIKDPSPPRIDWILCAERRLLPVEASAIVTDIDETRKFMRILPTMPFPATVKHEVERVLSRPERSAPVRSLYLGPPELETYARDQTKLSRYVRSFGGDSALKTIIVLSPIDLHNSFSLTRIDQELAGLKFDRISTESFAGDNTRVTVYRTLTPDSAEAAPH